MAQHDQVQARLAVLATAHGAGWVPAAPVEPTPEGAPPPVRPPIERPTPGGAPPAVETGELVSIRERAIVSAAATYTAAHGHRLDASELAGDERPHRWATRRRVAVAAAAALVVLGGAVALHAAAQTPSVVVPVDHDAVPADPGVEAPDAVPAAEAPEVVVHVVGEVARPGLVRLPEGSRLADAIDAAGGAGPEADLAAVNLARVLTDGEQVVVPRPGEVIAQAGQPPADAGAIDLNAAGAGELDALPGIGPVLAQRIVDWRSDHGRFATVDELAEVSGIGPTLLERVRDLVRVG